MNNWISVNVNNTAGFPNMHRMSCKRHMPAMRAYDCKSKKPHRLRTRQGVQKHKRICSSRVSHHCSDVPQLSKQRDHVTFAITPGDCCAAPLFLKPVELSPSTWTSSCCNHVASPKEIQVLFTGSKSPQQPYDQNGDDQEYVQGLSDLPSCRDTQGLLSCTHL